MKKYIVSSLAETVGNLWEKMQNEKTKTSNFYIAVPLSSTPQPIYQWVIEHAHEFDHWDKTKFLLMDEMLEGVPTTVSYIGTDDPASYEGFAHKYFLDPLREKTGVSIEVIKPNLSEITLFDTPIDLLILALGIDGNYANVMPGTEENVGWHIAHLTEAYRQVHTSEGGAFGGSKFGKYGMSLGPQQVFRASETIVIVSGAKKHDLTEKLLSYDHFDQSFPLSIIYHPEVKDRVSMYISEDVGVMV